MRLDMLDLVLEVCTGSCRRGGGRPKLDAALLVCLECCLLSEITYGSKR